VATPQKSEYKLFTGNVAQVQQGLSVLATQNWRPILMSNTQSPGGPVAITIILEHVLGT